MKISTGSEVPFFRRRTTALSAPSRATTQTALSSRCPSSPAQRLRKARASSLPSRPQTRTTSPPPAAAPAARSSTVSSPSKKYPAQKRICKTVYSHSEKKHCGCFAFICKLSLVRRNRSVVFPSQLTIICRSFFMRLRKVAQGANVHSLTNRFLSG